MIELKHVDTAGKGAENVVAFPQKEQDAIASQILASLTDEESWKTLFA